MSLKRTTRNIGKIGILFALLLTFVLVSDATAQCYCEDDAYYRAPVRRQTTYVRRSARISKPKRVYRAKRTTVYQPVYRAAPRTTVYQPVYVPVRRDDYDDSYERRVYTDNRVYTNDYYRNGEVDADYYDTRRIARDYGYRDGFEDGEEAGLERDTYHPENSGDYQKATNGYEGDFGNKNVYRQAYRSAYLSGYRTGFRTIANRSTYRAVRNW